MFKTLRAVLAAAGLAVAATSAHAVTFTYNWVGTESTGGGTVGAGFMTFDTPSVGDPANFTAGASVTLANLVAFSYTWNNGTATRTIDASSLDFANPPTFSAVGGVLNTMILTDFPTNSFALTIAPSTLTAVGSSENSSTGAFIDRDQGAWRLAPIPEPGTLALLLAGLAGIAGIARRRLH